MFWSGALLDPPRAGMTHKTFMAPVNSDLKPLVRLSLVPIVYEATNKHVRERRRGQWAERPSLAVEGLGEAQYSRLGQTSTISKPPACRGL